MIRDNNTANRIKDFFVKPPDPKELVRKWQTDLRKEQRTLERTIREIERSEKNAKKMVTESAKRGDMASAKVLAKELVRTRKEVTRMYTNKAQLLSMNIQLTEQLAMVRVAGTLSKSTEVMTLVNNLVKAPQMSQIMMQMSREMMKAGVIDEMMEDTLDSALDTEDMEEQTEAEVDKVLAELAVEDMSSMAKAGTANKRIQQQQAAQAQAAQEADSAEQEDLQARLDAMRS
ncbi:hypothetical protein WJX73_008465 [Symbiochloris irregularis]|uniref:Uncharacterized protein n=1 Tax=Symbiochloris irregularis TaxID=706552 RepID=A0AAW1NYY8_9CHLO